VTVQRRRATPKPKGKGHKRDQSGGSFEARPTGSPAEQYAGRDRSGVPVSRVDTTAFAGGGERPVRKPSRTRRLGTGKYAGKARKGKGPACPSWRNTGGTVTTSPAMRDQQMGDAKINQLGCWATANRGGTE